MTSLSPVIVTLQGNLMTPAAQFGRRLREIRRGHKLKIGQLAEKADTGVKHLGRVERGEKKPSFELIIALAAAMSVSPAKFFEFDSPQADPRVLRKQLDKFLSRRDAKELQQIQRVLAAFFDS
ncbi:MAG TPA: helix-turn-helix transcriptional regulator [Candidatus Acidoferrales bacterium]|jgi:transcriptional regulator with XRE-family HTH domain|nr:helix-turn-helix transcriptional regulator [Candidatus Acidoferrales bacterium]